MTREIRTVTNNERASMYQVLATAFARDPVVRWLVTDPDRDPALFRFLDLAAHGAPGSADILLDDGEPVGAAMWDPPGHKPTKKQTVTTIPLLLNTFRTRVPRAGAADRVFTRHRPDEPHWYLSTLGAVAGGRGIGTTLLRHRLDQIDGPAYLESSNVVNIPLYERFGFVVTDEISLPWGGPKIWPMYRQG